MTAIYLLFKAFQPGLFDQQVQVAGHVTKRGTVVAPYHSTRKKRPEPPPGEDLFAQADRRAMEAEQKKAKEDAERKAREEAEKAEREAAETAKAKEADEKPAKFQTKPVPSEYGEEAQRGVFVIGSREDLKIAFMGVGIKFVYNQKEKAAFVAAKDLGKLADLQRGSAEPPAVVADGPPPPLDGTMEFGEIVARGKAMVEHLYPGFHDALQKATEDKEVPAKLWSDLRDRIKRAVERKIDKKTRQAWMKKVKAHEFLWEGEDTRAEARKELAAAADMFGPCPYVRGLIKKEKRAYYNSVTKDINVGARKNNDGGLRTSIFHEYGHAMEYFDHRVMQAATMFHAAKRTGKGLIQIPGHQEGETAYPGDFIHPSVGRRYLDGATEVIRVGTQQFVDSKTMAEFYEKAPDHFYLIMAINTALDARAETTTKSYLFMKAA